MSGTTQPTTADPIMAEASRRLLITALEIRGRDAVDEARGRVERLADVAGTFTPALVAGPGGRADWPLDKIRKALADHHAALVQAEAMEDLADGDEPDFSEIAATPREVAQWVADKFIAGQDHKGLTWLVGQAQTLLAAARADLADAIPRAMAMPLDQYRRHRSAFLFAGLHDRLMPLLARQVEAEGLVALLDPLLSNLTAALATAAGKAIADAGGSPQVIAGIQEAAILRGNGPAPDATLAQLQAQYDETDRRVRQLADAGAEGPIAQRTAAHRDELVGKISARKSQLTEDARALARSIVDGAAAGDVGKWAGLCGRAASDPQSFQPGFHRALVAALAGVMLEGDAEGWGLVLEASLRPEDAEPGRRRLAAVGLARGSSPAAGP